MLKKERHVWIHPDTKHPRDFFLPEAYVRVSGLQVVDMIVVNSLFPFNFNCSTSLPNHVLFGISTGCRVVIKDYFQHVPNKTLEELMKSHPSLALKCPEAIAVPTHFYFSDKYKAQVALWRLTKTIMKRAVCRWVSVDEATRDARLAAKQQRIIIDNTEDFTCHLTKIGPLVRQASRLPSYKAMVSQ